MSERDIERLGNRPFRPLKVPAWFAESKSKISKARIWRKTFPGYVPALHDNTVKLSGETDRQIRFAKNLISDNDEYIEYRILPEREIIIALIVKERTANAYIHKNGASFTFPKRLAGELELENGIYEAFKDQNNVFINLERPIEKQGNRGMPATMVIDADAEDIKHLREEGLSIRKIAKKTGLPKSTVHNILQREQKR